MEIYAGTVDTYTTHSAPAGIASELVAAGVPLALIGAGVAIEGVGAIAWADAAVAGAAGATLLGLFLAAVRASRLTDLRLFDQLGSFVARSDTMLASLVGLVIHIAIGATLGVAFAYTMVLFGWTAGAEIGAVWGVGAALLAMLMLSSLGVVHPKIRDGRQEDPGPLAANCGALTPALLLIGHIGFGAAVGGLYAAATMV